MTNAPCHSCCLNTGVCVRLQLTAVKFFFLNGWVVTQQLLFVGLAVVERTFVVRWVLLRRVNRNRTLHDHIPCAVNKIHSHTDIQCLGSRFFFDMSNIGSCVFALAECYHEV